MSLNPTRLLQFSQQARKFYTRQFAALLARTGLSMREVDVLLFLANNPGYDTARDVTEFRGLSKSQVSQAVDLLAAENLLRRQPDQADRRIIHLAITSQGEPLARECRRIQAQCVQQLLAVLTPEEERQFHSLLNAVLDHSERIMEEAITQ